MTVSLGGEPHCYAAYGHLLDRADSQCVASITTVHGWWTPGLLPNNCTRARRWASKGEILLLMNTPRGCTSGSPDRGGTCYSRIVGLISTWKWVSLSFSSVHSGARL